MADVTEQLRDKIKSKMDVAKFFAGFLTVLTGFLLKENVSESFWYKAGVICLAASIGFCIATVFAYDRLLMPVNYWFALPELEKTKDKFHGHLYKNMIRSWWWLFVPAVGCFAAGFVFILLEKLQLLEAQCTPCQACQRSILAILLFIAVFLPLVTAIVKGPRVSD